MARQEVHVIPDTAQFRMLILFNLMTGLFEPLV